MGTRFDDSFWESDFNGTLGFDLLCKRMREGQKVCHDVIDFFRKRSKADLQYSKTLRILARNADGREETGVLGASWQSFKSQTENTATLHENSSQHYNRLADDLSRYADGAKVEIKQIEDKVKDRQKMKRNAHSKMVEYQKTYTDKCRDMINQERQFEVAKQSVTTSLKDLEKFKTKAEKSREVMEKSDMAYKQSVDTLEQIRVSWEADMEEGCQNFQRLEEERIFNIRDDLWKCSNIDSQLCVYWDESCETVRQCLEKCDIQREMLDYVRHTMTGKVRPAQIHYSNYFDDRSKNPTHLNLNKCLSSPRKTPSSPSSPYAGMCFDDTYAYIK